MGTRFDRKLAALLAIVAATGIAVISSLLGDAVVVAPPARDVARTTVAVAGPAAAPVEDAGLAPDEANAKSETAPVRTPIASPSDPLADAPRAVVRVVDSRGAPAEGILVELVGGGCVLANESGEAVFTGITLDPLLSTATDETPLVARIWSPLPVPCEVSLPRAAFLAGGAVLTLPPLAEVTVAIFVAGARRTGLATISLETPDLRKSGFGALERGKGSGPRTVKQTTTIDGFARFRNVLPGLRYSATAHFGGVAHRSLGSQGEGEPTATQSPDQREGENESLASLERPLALKIDVQPCPTYRARLIGFDGEPLRSSDIEVRPWSDVGLPELSTGEPTERAVSDSNGVLSVTWAWDADDFAISRWLMIRTRADPRSGWTPVDVTQLTAPCDYDLGDVALLPLRLIAGGTVVDSAGGAIAGASIRVTLAADEDFATRGSAASISRRIALFALENPQSNSNAAGHFEIRGTLNAADLGLVAQKYDFLTSPALRFSAPRDDLLVALTRTGSICGSVVLWDGADLAQVEATLDRTWPPPPTTQTTRTARSTLLEEPTHVDIDATNLHSFRAAQLTPGRWTFRLRYGLVMSLLEVADIVVSPGTITRDSRLENLRIELGDRLVRRQVLVVDAVTGESIPASCSFHTSRIDDNSKTVRQIGGQVESSDARGIELVLEPDARPAVFVEALMHRPRTVVLGNDAVTTVELEPVGAVKLHPIGLPPGFGLSVTLVLVSTPAEIAAEPAREHARVSAYFRDAKSLRVHPPWPGLYRAEWNLPLLPLQRQDLPTVEITIPNVNPGEAPPTIDLEIPPELLRFFPQAESGSK